MEPLHLFSANSANEKAFKHLRLVGASLFIPQLNTLLETQSDYDFNIIDVQNFQNESSIALGNIFANNKSDKSTTHNYHIMYSFILNKLGTREKLNVLEIGLGTNNPSLISTMGSGGRPGASLYSFRDYLPNSNIYGCDIDKQILFQSDRIKTCFVDQLKMQTFDDLSNNFGNIKYDLIIDDGLHSIGANFNTLLFALNNINENGWIVIEDIDTRTIKNWKIIDYVLKNNSNYKTYIIKTKVHCLYVVNRLK